MSIVIGEETIVKDKDLIWWLDRITELEQENKKLKSDLAFNRTMLDNVSAEYESSQDVIKKLKEKIRFLEQCLDNKEEVNKQLRKDIKWYEKEEDRLREENKRLSDFLECEA